MGHSVSALRKQLANDAIEEKKQECGERLQILEKMIEQRLETQKIDILNGEKHDQEIDTGTIVSLHKMVYIKMTEGKGEGEGENIKKVIDRLFSGDFIGGLESIVELGAETVLGNYSIGEHETKDMFIVWSDNALLRCDAYYYRWNFSSTSVINDTEGVTGVLLMKRVIDLTKTDPQVLTWAITNMVDRVNNGEEKPHPREVVAEAMKVLEKVVEFQAKVKAMEAGREPGKL